MNKCQNYFKKIQSSKNSFPKRIKRYFQTIFLQKNKKELVKEKKEAENKEP